MSNDLVMQAKSAGLVSMTDMDAFAGYGKELAAEYNVLGTFLTFSGNTGDYKAGDQPVDHGTQFVVDVLAFQRGWICWKNKKPIDRAMVPIFPPQPIPSQSTLKDHGPYAKRQDGSDAEGWSEIIEGTFSDPATGETYKFGLSSKSGIRSLGKLVSEFFTKARMFVDDQNRPKLPIVEISATSFPVAGGPNKFAPVLNIVGWMDRDEYERLAPEAPTEEAAEEEVYEEAAEEIVEEIPLAPAKTTVLKPRPAAPAAKPAAAPAQRAGYKGGVKLK